MHHSDGDFKYYNKEHTEYLSKTRFANMTQNYDP